MVKKNFLVRVLVKNFDSILWKIIFLESSETCLKIIIKKEF